MHKPASPWSLRNRLLAIAALASITAWLFGGAAMYTALSDESERLFDDRLRGMAETVLSFADHELAETQQEVANGTAIHHEIDMAQGTRYRYQLWSGDGKLLLRSADAPAATPLAPLQSSGFFSVTTSGTTLRTYSISGHDGRTVIQVAEDIQQRQAVVHRLGTYLIGFFVLSVLLIGAVSWLLLRSALHPLHESAREIVERGPGELSPLSSMAAPRELVPMLHSINTLLARVDAALSAERGFTAVAAHELRTPLASLRMQAQVAGRALETGERDRALGGLVGSVDRLSHLVEQLLALARLDALNPGDPPRKPVDLRRLLHEVLTDLGPLAADKDLSIETHFAQAPLNGVEFALAMLLRNLVGNAVRHTPPGGRLAIRSTLDTGHLVLTVDDSGPGIPVSEREDAFERFHRGPHAAGSGSGLGLSIVQSVARLHGASINLTDAPLGGLRVALRFPLEDHANLAEKLL